MTTPVDPLKWCPICQQRPLKGRDTCDTCGGKLIDKPKKTPAS